MKEDKIEEVFEEQIFTDEFLREIGFRRIKGVEGNQYGEAWDSRMGGLTRITWNNEGHSVTYFGDKLAKNVALRITKDAGTRTVFSGYAFTKDDVRLYLTNTW